MSPLHNKFVFNFIMIVRFEVFHTVCCVIACLLSAIKLNITIP